MPDFINNPEKSALIVIDLQNDFCPGGALAVAGGDIVVDGINRLLRGKNSFFQKAVLTADWHPAGHVSFASSHKKEPYTELELDGEHLNLWPDHCLQGTRGAEFHPALDTVNADLIIRKGRSPVMDSYSAFFENDRKTPTGLFGYLKDHGITDIYLCGLAMDWCVYFSATDAKNLGFRTIIPEDLTRPVDVPAGYAAEKAAEMSGMGIEFIDSGLLRED